MKARRQLCIGVSIGAAIVCALTAWAAAIEPDIVLRVMLAVAAAMSGLVAMDVAVTAIYPERLPWKEPDA